WEAIVLTVEVTNGGGDSIYIEAADFGRYFDSSRMFTHAEWVDEHAAGPPLTGPNAMKSVTDSAVG
ncbi:MAG: hypothetical protein P8Y36_06740, partial [Alphaproteobacteria bacterium]